MTVSLRIHNLGITRSIQALQEKMNKVRVIIHSITGSNRHITVADEEKFYASIICCEFFERSLKDTSGMNI